MEMGHPPRLIGEVLEQAARRTPAKAALICGDARLDFRSLDRLANRFAQALLAARLPGRSRVAIMCRNGPEYVAVHFGAARTGLVLVHLSARLTAVEMAHILNKTGARLLVADAPSLGILADARPALDRVPRIIGVGPGLAEGVTGFGEFIAGQPDEPPEASIEPGDSFSILFTGGTTGKPKGAVASHRARLTSGRAAVEDFPLSADHIAAVTTPLCHAAGLFTWFQPALQAGATCVIMEKWDPAQFIAAVERHRITAGFVVPVQLAMLLDDPSFSAARLNSLEMIACGGAPATRELLARTEAALPRTRLVLAYGSTETGHLTCLQPAARRAKPGSIGRPGRRMEMKVFSAPGVQAARGEVGEVATRGPHLMEGYLDEADQTADYFRSGDGWGWTGDLGSMDQDGDVTLAGRRTDMIISGGVNVYPAEIETALNEHPEIKECAAFGLPHAKWGEVPAVAAVVQDDARLSETDILDYCAARVARFKRPRLAVILDELPRTGGGKIQRTRLREAYAEAELP